MVFFSSANRGSSNRKGVGRAVSLVGEGGVYLVGKARGST